MISRLAPVAPVLAALAVAGPALAGNLVVNGGFRAGNTGFSTGYSLTTMTPYRFQNAVHGIYTIEPASGIAHSAAYGDWTNITTDPKGGHGRVLVADAATTAGVVAWSQTVAVTPNTRYQFSFYGAEVSNACCSNATLMPSVNGTAGAVLTAGATWQKTSFIWNSGTATMATLAVTDTNVSGPYNDFALDLFSFKAIGQ